MIAGLVGILTFLLFLSPWVDIPISAYFFDGAFSTHFIFSFIYSYLIFPAWLVIGCAFLYFFHPKWNLYNRHAIYLILTLAIGSGVITHALLKDHWGRPRPRQIVEFGGGHVYRPFYSPDFSQTEPTKSFPCGHCTMGFYFISLIYSGKRLGLSWIVVVGWGCTLFLGLALSWARIAQGGHFLSDTVAAACVMWIVAHLLDRYFLGRTARAESITHV